jgi:hypothetical protein
MRLSQLGATLVVAVVGGAIGGILTNFLVENTLLLSSEWQIQAAVSLGFVLAVLVVFAAIGAPWRRWKRTPYW